MVKLRMVAALAAVLMTSPALAKEITVWDVNVDEPSHATYYDHAKAAFEAAHPGDTLTFLSQPDAEYYTLLGTALASKTGPDVIWANGGAQAKNTAFLTPQRFIDPQRWSHDFRYLDQRRLRVRYSF